MVKVLKETHQNPMLHMASPVFWGLSPVQGVEKGAFSLLHLDVKFAQNWLLWGTPHEWRPRGIINPRPPDSIYTNYWLNVLLVHVCSCVCVWIQPPAHHNAKEMVCYVGAECVAVLFWMRVACTGRQHRRLFCATH